MCLIHSAITTPVMLTMSLSVASRWRYDYNWISSLRRVQGRTLIKNV